MSAVVETKGNWCCFGEVEFETVPNGISVLNPGESAYLVPAKRGEAVVVESHFFHTNVTIHGRTLDGQLPLEIHAVVGGILEREVNTPGSYNLKGPKDIFGLYYQKDKVLVVRHVPQLTEEDIIVVQFTLDGGYTLSLAKAPHSDNNQQTGLVAKQLQPPLYQPRLFD